MTDITERLRDTGLHSALEAADEIERLRAALEEPTDAMIEAGEEEIAQRRATGCRVYASDIYRVMMAALRGQG